MPRIRVEEVRYTLLLISDQFEMQATMTLQDFLYLSESISLSLPSAVWQCPPCGIICWIFPFVFVEFCAGRVESAPKTCRSESVKQWTYNDWM